MEPNDSYPVFHTRLMRTQRRRLTWPDGTDAGWLITNDADQFTEVAADLNDLASDVTDALNGLTVDEHSVHDASRPPLPRQLRRVPGASCPVPGCDHRHDNLREASGPDDPPQPSRPTPR